MKAVILVGGQGTRLRPLTTNIPKPMLPMVNMPFFEHTLRMLKSFGIRDIILSSGYLGDHFENYFKDGKHLGVNLTHIVEEKPLGTCGAVKNVEKLLGNDTTVILNGDVLTNVNLNQLHDYHKNQNAKVTLTLYSVEDPTAYGLVQLNGNNRVQEFLEKPSFDEVTTHWINAGIYLLEPEVLKYAPEGENYSFERGLFPTLLKNDELIFGFPFSGYWKDIGTPTHYLKAHHDLLEGRVNLEFSGKEIKPSVYVGKNCQISDKATLFGPTVIGDNCTIEDDAMIFSYTTLGNNCHISKSAKIYDSIVFDNTKIGPNCIVKDSVIAKDVQIASEVHIEDLTILGDEALIGHRNYLSKGIKLAAKSVLEKEQIRF